MTAMLAGWNSRSNARWRRSGRVKVFKGRLLNILVWYNPTAGEGDRDERAFAVGASR